MQVFCRKAAGNAELHCCVCGQGFVMLWERQTAVERAVLRVEILEYLRNQHREVIGPEAHPQSEFVIPEWEGTALTTAGAAAGQPSIWDL